MELSDSSRMKIKSSTILILTDKKLTNLMSFIGADFRGLVGSDV